jgi:hypothetical protein
MTTTIPRAVSIREEDACWTPDAAYKYRVLLDGAELQKCVAADMDSGVALVREFVCGQFVDRKVTGRVEIVDRKATPTEPEWPALKVGDRVMLGPYHRNKDDCEGTVLRVDDDGDPIVKWYGQTETGTYHYRPYRHDVQLAPPEQQPQPVATEWVDTQNVLNSHHRNCDYVRCAECPRNNDMTDCSSRGHYEHRWPSGVVGEGKPEFRVKPDQPAIADAKFPHELRRIKIAYISAATVTEGGGAPCPHCQTLLPASLVTQIAAGDVDCPSCGWRKGRCRYCCGLIVPQYRGKPRCQDCHNEQE